MDIIGRVCSDLGYPFPTEATIRLLMGTLGVSTHQQLKDEVERFLQCELDELVSKQKQDAL